MCLQPVGNCQNSPHEQEEKDVAFVIAQSIQLLKATLQPKKNFLSSADICQRRETLVIGSRPCNVH